jgi:hypothetical protein
MLVLYQLQLNGKPTYHYNLEYQTACFKRPRSSTMRLPHSLQRELDRALEAVTHHPDHALIPLHRLRIYQQFGSLTEQAPLLAHAWRDILTVYQVLPIWKANWTEELVVFDPWTGQDYAYFDPEYATNLAERVIKDGANPDEARDLLSQGIEQVSLSGELPNSPRHNTYAVCEAAVKALATSLGSLSFLKAAISAHTTDADLSFDYGDTALYAAIAAAGQILAGTQVQTQGQCISVYEISDEQLLADDPWREQVYDPYADSNKRLHFWTWWLTEAIPEAWRLASE